MVIKRVCKLNAVSLIHINSLIVACDVSQHFTSYKYLT